ncbi:MAG TPA: sigma-70 family RNA polymerase sigma factor [Polyangiaceae bacterium]|nr:sigma-70 family RNA polymerase sigma factor [Polyangiaceae bacterium]
MLSSDPPFAELRSAREHFLALVAEVRPDLHRYCARMTGSVADGEDVVQETLARAYFMLPELPAMPELRPWLFRVAHNRALDFLRRYERRMSEPLEANAPFVAEELTTADEVVAAQQAVALALGRFLELPPVPRSCVILKDVLGHSIEEIAVLLELAVPGVKAALYRGRQRLRVAAVDDANATTRSTSAPSPLIARYVELFNAHDWDGVRALLADDVRLDLVSRAQRRGREVGEYMNNYEVVHDWHLRAAWLGEREVIAVLRDPSRTTAAYFIELTLEGDRIQHIRDYRYVPYITHDAPLRLELP